MSLDDWMDNGSWFDVKLLADIVGDASEELTSDSHRDKVKAILQALNLPCDKLLHLGRELGSKLLDLLEEETKEIKRMGQWSDGAWERAHSSKLPLAPIRKVAGFSKMCFNTRTSIEPPEELLRATPIGAWARDALAAVTEHNMETGKCPAAIAFLQFMCHLNRIFLQDAAATVALHPVRETHPLFGELPVFQEEAWEVRTHRC